MRIGIAIFLTIIGTLLFMLDWYVFQGIQTLTATLENPFWTQSINWGHWVLSAVLGLSMVFAFLNRHRMKPWFSITSGLFTTMLVTKLVFVVVLMGGDAVMLAEGAINWIAGNGQPGEGLPERRIIFSQVALLVAAIPFTSFLYGITKGKYKYKVHRHILHFDDLPEAFDGFTIAQISDIHSGSLDDTAAVRRGVEMVKAQNPDLFVFTGDLVNTNAAEFDPWVAIFKEIKAPYGQFSILGNHDYGDYHAWPHEAAKRANFEALKAQHEKTGFRLLLDEQVEIEKDGEKIHVLGVENWGLGFGQKGDLKKAMRGVPHEAFKVLLSHDPSHWDHEVKHQESPVHLTLSGHTHGMQMGVDLPKLKWSPIKYRYPKWAGLYEEAGKFLNVNRGFGFHGFAGRVGVWPEITILELKSKK